MPLISCPMVDSQECWLKGIWESAVYSVRGTSLVGPVTALPCERHFHVGLRRSIIVQMEGSTDLPHMLLRDRYRELSVHLYSDLDPA